MTGDRRARLAELLRERPRTFPASFGQQRLWFLDRMDPGSPVFHIPVGLRLTGPLRVDALRRGLDRIVARHAILRTTFTEGTDGRPVQVVARASAADMTVDVAGDFPEALRLAEAEATAPFDLARGPLFRSRLIRLADDDHLLVLNIHHIAADAWSLPRLLAELATCYAADLHGGTPDLPDLPIQYGDYAVWQHERLAGADMDARIGYWTDRLAGAPALLTLPTDRARPAVASDRGALYEVPLPRELAGAVRELSRSLGGTMFVTMMAAFQVLLSRYSGQSDVVVGVPVADRGHAETHDLIGLFLTMLALRTSLADQPTFRELVVRVREGFLAAMDHADVPFERLVELIRPGRSLSYSPIFQAQLIVLNTPPRELALPGVTVTRVPLTTGTAKVDLSLSVDPRGEDLMLVFEYRTELFDEATIARFARHLVALLTAVAADPDRRVGQIPLLSGADRTRVLVGWNATEQPLPPVRSLAELLTSRLAAADQAAPAVVDAEQSLSYADLTGAAHRLAQRLRSRGAGPDERVGLFCDRSAAVVTAILGIWLAGAGYVPLDPGWPADRLRTVMDDAEPRLILTSRSMLERLPPGRTAVCLDDPAEETPERPPPGRPATGDCLAYLLYTSGSTGRPKGVVVPQRAVVNLLLSYADRLGLTTADRWAAVTTPTFDISVVELVLPLLCGATVVVVPAAEAADGIALRRRLASTGATVMQATPATWRMLTIAGGVPARVRIRLTGGEALSRDLAAALLADGSVLWNGYGPTETTIYSSAGLVRRVQRAQP